MKQGNFKIISNEKIAKNTFEIILTGDTSDITAPGQFVNIRLDGFYLRRPISVCSVCGDLLTLIYKAVGRGTEYLSTLKEGAALDILTGLGNGYDLSVSGDAPLLIGGGAGVPPMYMLAERLTAMGKSVTVILGFNTESEAFYTEEFRTLSARVIVATADGSVGTRGFVTDAMVGLNYSYLYTCGPEPMLKAVYAKSLTSGQFSFEERMGCGFGACMGCSCRTKYGTKRICKDGPVLRKGEIVW